MSGDTFRQGAIATVTGRMVRDAEVRITPGGKQVANFTLAVNHRRKNDQGQWEDDGKADFYRVSAWDEAAEPAAHIAKGQLVRVTGRLRTSEYLTTGGFTRTDLCLTTDRTADIQPDTANTTPEDDPWT